MTTVLEKYHDFLQEEDIQDYPELLCVLLEEPYYLHISTDIKHDDLIIFNITEETNLDIDIVHIFDGLIISKIDIRQIVCYSNNFFEEIGENDVNSSLNFNLKGVTFKEIEQGEYIRVFNYDDEWIVSTLISIDANTEIIKDSESITVKNIFDMVCSKCFDYQRLLNKQYVYFFSLNTDFGKYNLVHINTFNASSSFKEVTHNLPLQRSVEVKFKNIPNLLETCSLSKHTTIGFFINDSNKNRNYKIFTDAYLYVSMLKGSETDITKQFITLKRSGLIVEYLKYFPEKTRVFSVLAEICNWYVEYLYKSYVNIKIHKQVKQDNEYLPKEKEIIQDIHSIYLDSRVNTSKDTVELLLHSYPVDFLRELLINRRN